MNVVQCPRSKEPRDESLWGLGASWLEKIPAQCLAGLAAEDVPGEILVPQAPGEAPVVRKQSQDCPPAEQAGSTPPCLANK